MISQLKEKYNNIPIGVKAALWYTICNLLQKAISIFVIPLYTRLLTPAEYGTYSVFMSWVELFEVFVTLKLFMGTYTVGLVKYEEDRDRFTSSLEQLSLLITTAFLGLYMIFQNQVNSITGLDLPMTLMLFLMMYAFPIVGFWKTLQKVDNLYRNMVIAVLSISILTPALGLTSILLISRTAKSAIISRVMAEVIVAVAIFIIYRKIFTKKPSKNYCKYALYMAVPLVPFYLSAMLLNHSDRIIIERLVGGTEAGIYSVAYSAAMIMQLFNTAFESSIQPWLFKTLKAKKYNTIPGKTTAVVIVVAVLNLMLIAFAPEAIMILAPPSYHEAIWIVPPLAASVFVMFYYQRFINVEFYYNESAMTSVASIIAAAMNIVLNFIFIPKFGYLAAGYTTLVSYMVFWLTHYIYYRKVCKKNDCPLTVINNKQLLLVSALFAASAGVLMIGYDKWPIRYGFILMMIIVCIVKRNYIISTAKDILNGKKQKYN